MSGDNSDAQYGAKPAKEMRTVRRDGDIVIEDYEKMNPDGTVTKTITTTDEKTGQKQVNVYRMDKSGIVRKMDALEQKEEDLLQQLRDQLAETKEKVQALKDYREKQNSKSVMYESGENENGEPYRRRVVEDIPDDKYEMAYDIRNLNKPIELTPKQQAKIRQHKENILNYGTQKLIKQLHKKLSDDKFNKAYPLTDEQKDSVIEYGIRKLHKLLEKNLDEQKLVNDLISFDPDFGKVDLSGRGNRLIPGDQSVAFNLNPYKELAPEEYAKPVSFSMRPEKPSKALPEPDVSPDRKVINNGYQALWNRLMNPDSILESVEGKQNTNEKSKDEKYDSASEEVDSDWQQKPTDENQGEPNNFKQIKNSVKKIMADDELYQKSPLSSDQKEGIIDYALQQVRSVLKDSVKKENESKESSSRKKKINLLEYFDEDEIYDYGRRALKKLVRRSLKAFDLDQDILRLDKVEDPELSERRDAFYQYLGDVVEGKVKESDPIPIKQKTKQEEAPEPEEEPKWDYNSLLSSIFGKDKTLKSEEKPKVPKNKENVIDALFSWLLPDKEEKTGTEKVAEQPSVPKVKPRFYQLDPQADSQSQQNKPEVDNTHFDLKALLKKIQDAAVKKFSEPKENENTESLDQQSYQDQAQTNVNNKVSQERGLKPSEVDAALNRIRQIHDEASNSKRVTNKPPYLKERISGLNTIPRPKITTASPSERNADFSDKISFQLKPHNYDTTNEEGDKSRSFENQRIETAKPSKHEQDFQPWWFESPESFVRKAFTEKPVINGGFMGSPMIDSFSSRKALE